MFAIATFGIPILGSFLTLIADRFSRILRNTLAALIALATLACCLALIPSAGLNRTIMVGPSSLPGLNFNFVIDGLGVFMAIMSSLIGLLIVFYSMGYMSEYKYQGEYYFLVVMFLGAMVGLVLSANLLLIYIFWEITAICSWRLIGFYRQPQHLRNADTALMMTVFGSFLMLVGLEMIWHETGSLNLSAVHGHTVSNLALFFIFIGILAKSAQVPLQVWLPGAGVAPSPVTALLHAATLVVIGVFAFARIFVGVFHLPLDWQIATSAVAVSTILVAGGAALMENNAKRILAYSTLGQLGYAYLGLASMNAIGITGGLIYLLAHSLAKAGLFLCVGIIEHKTHTRDLRELGGLLRTMPITAITFILCMLTIVGFPPTAGFFGKLMIFMGSMQSGKTLFVVGAVLGAILTVIYMLRMFNAIFLGPERWKGTKEGTPIMLAIVILFAAFSLLIGFAIQPLANLVTLITTQLIG
jgi:NADH:ubiquinone oxidoreductase subunit 5 (subunit L)/multisubunit Na+/H+ antiporter MnhA subunit